MKLILIINNELFASVIMKREKKKKHSIYTMQQCWLSLNISSEICFGSIKKYIHNYIFFVFELQISLDRLESATKQMSTLKFCLIQEVIFIKKKKYIRKNPQRCSARAVIFEKEETSDTWNMFQQGKRTLEYHSQSVLMLINRLQ